MIDTAPPSHYEWQAPTNDSPRLILHFDINKTLIATDETTKKTAEETVSEEIAKRVMGCWDESVQEPMSYIDYVKERLAPNPHRSPEIKLKQREAIKNVMQHLKEREHPDYRKMQDLYNRAMASLKDSGRQVFPSFYRLVQVLKEKKIPYTIAIRTYGQDGQTLARELNQHLGDNFMTDLRVLKDSPFDIYDLVTQGNHHVLIQDDWHVWSSHGCNWLYGKPFPVDLSDSRYISLFFDDNADEIISPYDVTSQEPILPSDLAKRGQIITVDTLEAILDENYFLQHVEKVPPIAPIDPFN